MYSDQLYTFPYFLELLTIHDSISSEPKQITLKMVEQIKHKNEILALIIRSSFKKKGIEFFTPNDNSLQVGYMNRPKEYTIKPHISTNKHYNRI